MYQFTCLHKTLLFIAEVVHVTNSINNRLMRPYSISYLAPNIMKEIVSHEFDLLHGYM